MQNKYTKENILKKLLLIIILIGIVTIALLYSFKPQIMQTIYPIKYQEHVKKSAQEMGIDELLIYSIIKAESGFEANVKSASGAIGLMQIMLPTAEEIARELGIEDITEKQLYEAETNIKIGTKYFSMLLDAYDNKLNLAIIAYNAGMGNVNAWIEDGTINEQGTDIENIPFAETKMYVKKILQNYEIYKEIY
mgnify:FL=1